MNKKKNPKKNRSFRFSDEVFSFLSRAGEQTALSDVEIIERCVLEKIVEVVRKNAKLSHLLEHDAVLDAFAKEVEAARRAIP
jgi:hypothetical protein